MKKLAEIQQALKAPKGQTNNFGKYKYRSCEDILEAVKPLLGEATLTITDEVKAVTDRVYVCATATLTHEGETIEVQGWAREAQSKKGMDDAQVTGATSSYARKYALNGLFCIDDTKDADATNEHGKKPAPKKQLTEGEKAVAKARQLYKIYVMLDKEDANLIATDLASKAIDPSEAICKFNAGIAKKREVTTGEG